LLYKFNIPLNDLHREYIANIKSLSKKEVKELLNILTIQVIPSENKKDTVKIKEVEKKLNKFLEDFEYLKAYEYIKSMRQYFNSDEFDILY